MARGRAGMQWNTVATRRLEARGKFGGHHRPPTRLPCPLFLSVPIFYWTGFCGFCELCHLLPPPLKTGHPVPPPSQPGNSKPTPPFTPQGGWARGSATVSTRRPGAFLWSEGGSNFAVCKPVVRLSTYRGGGWLQLGGGCRFSDFGR